MSVEINTTLEDVALTTERAAEILGISVITCQRYLRNGVLPGMLLSVSGEGHTMHRWFVQSSDVMALKAKRESGDPQFKPGPEAKADGSKTHIYVPRSRAWGHWLTGTLPAEDRAIVLEHYARMRAEQPKRYQMDIEDIAFSLRDNGPGNESENGKE